MGWSQNCPWNPDWHSHVFGILSLHPPNLHPAKGTQMSQAGPSHPFRQLHWLIPTQSPLTQLSHSYSLQRVPVCPSSHSQVMALPLQLPNSHPGRGIQVLQSRPLLENSNILIILGKQDLKLPRCRPSKITRTCVGLGTDPIDTSIFANRHWAGIIDIQTHLRIMIPTIIADHIAIIITEVFVSNLQLKIMIITGHNESYSWPYQELLSSAWIHIYVKILWKSRQGRLEQG